MSNKTFPVDPIPPFPVKIEVYGSRIELQEACLFGDLAPYRTVVESLLKLLWPLNDCTLTIEQTIKTFTLSLVISEPESQTEPKG